MIGLIIVRLVSWHFIDGFLYGAFKLNWVIDLGTSWIVLASALYYIKVVLTLGARAR